MYDFRLRFSWISVAGQHILEGVPIKQPFLKKIIFVSIFIILFLTVKNDFSPLYLGILGIAIISWITTPS